MLIDRFRYLFKYLSKASVGCLSLKQYQGNGYYGTATTLDNAVSIQFAWSWRWLHWSGLINLLNLMSFGWPHFCRPPLCTFLHQKSAPSCDNESIYVWFVCFCLFCCFTSQGNCYGHGGTVSSPNHTLFLGKLEQAVNQYFMHILWLVTDNNPSWMIQRKGGDWP